MSERKKTKNLETIKTFNVGLIFPCVVYLLIMDQLDFSSLLNYEYQLPSVKIPLIKIYVNKTCIKK